jgi:hypothetical protein
LTTRIVVLVESFPRAQFIADFCASILHNVHQFCAAILPSLFADASGPSPGAMQRLRRRSSSFLHWLAHAAAMQSSGASQLCAIDRVGPIYSHFHGRKSGSGSWFYRSNRSLVSLADHRASRRRFLEIGAGLRWILSTWPITRIRSVRRVIGCFRQMTAALASGEGVGSEFGAHGRNRFRKPVRLQHVFKNGSRRRKSPGSD